MVVNVIVFGQHFSANIFPIPTPLSKYLHNKIRFCVKMSQFFFFYEHFKNSNKIKIFLIISIQYVYNVKLKYI